jgi:hypothetical protein
MLLRNLTVRQQADRDYYQTNIQQDILPLKDSKIRLRSSLMVEIRVRVLVRRVQVLAEQQMSTVALVSKQATAYIMLDHVDG